MLSAGTNPGSSKVIRVTHDLFSKFDVPALR
jgi:hypothetical protein